MATADLKLLYGSGGSFTPSFYSGTLSIPSGSSGTMLTITAPAGKIVRLNMLHPGATTQTEITVNVDGSPVITNLNLIESTNTVGAFFIGASPGSPTSPLQYVQAKTTITVVKVTGSTTSAIFYSYCYGE